MKLYGIEYQGARRIGAEKNGKLIDLHATDPAVPADMLSLLRGGNAAMIAARRALDKAGAKTLDFSEVRVLAPVPRPGKILSSGINFRGHLEEEPGATLPQEPFFFSKLPSCVIGTGEAIVLPARSKQVDYEVELAVVIGKNMRNTLPNDVMPCIAGYTIHHDVSARDVQFKDNQITLGKNFDTFAPMGPCLVTSDEITNPANLRMRTFLNGKVMQDANTNDWVFSLPVLLSSLSEVMTLEPGDIVSTGCPAGVGAFRNPQVWLKAGDKVRLEIEGIGAIENPVVAEDTVRSGFGAR